MIGWIIGIGILLVVLFASLIGLVLWVMVRGRTNVTALIISDDGKATKKRFVRAPRSFTVRKKRYVYDEKAVFKIGDKKHVLYRESIPEPIGIHTFKNPKVLSSGEYEGVIKAEVHRQLFGASAMDMIKMISFITLAGVIVTVLLLGYLAFTSGSADPVILDPANKDLMVQAVREAIGR